MKPQKKLVKMIYVCIFYYLRLTPILQGEENILKNVNYIPIMWCIEISFNYLDNKN